MVALAGQVRAQVEVPPQFEPSDRFILPEGYNWPLGVAAADVIPFPGGGYPEIAITVSQLDVGNEFGRVPDRTPLVRIFLNTGVWDSGPKLTFAQDIELPEDATPVDVKFADINADDALDLVVACGAQENLIDGNSIGIWVFYNDGSGAFGETLNVNARFTATPTAVRGFSIADLNNDGFPDCLAASDVFGEFGDLRSVHVLRNEYDATTGLRVLNHFSTELPVSPNASSSNDVVIADFKRLPGVAKLDAVAGDFAGTPTFYQNIGLLDFTPTTIVKPLCPPDNTPPFWNFWDMATARLALGVLRDDVVGMGADNALLHVLHGNNQGGFTYDCNADAYDIDPNRVQLIPSVDIGHLNGGTKLDVIGTTLGPTVRLLMGDGTGHFQTGTLPGYNIPLKAVASDPPYAAGRAILADVDQDGYNDIIVSSHGATHDVFTYNNSALIVLRNKFKSTLP